MRKRIELLCQNCRRRYKCFSPCKRWNKQAQKEMGIKMKAFTITELVIVIAIIGILSAILIPTFASVVKSSTHEAVEIKNGEQQIIYVDKKGNVLNSIEGMKLVGARFEKGIVYLIYEVENESN